MTERPRYPPATIFLIMGRLPFLSQLLHFDPPLRSQADCEAYDSCEISSGRPPDRNSQRKCPRRVVQGRTLSS